MKAFVTGGTGFIGSHVIRQLQEKNYTIFALVRSQPDAAALQAQGVQPVIGDITERESMREGMTGSDVVFHIAGWYKISARDPSPAYKVNVEGTRNVLELAFELGVPRIVYTSTVAVYGDTHGRLVDEATPIPGGPFATEYDRTKWMAHVRVAQSLIEKGAPVIIVMPGGVYGPGDTSQLGELMRRYYQGQFPVFPAPEMALTFAHVDDIAAGHVLAAEKGKPGESYFLTGPAARLREMVQVWSEITGRPAPVAYLPPALAKPFAPLAGYLSDFLPIPELIGEESIRILDSQYTARSDKARQELGWTTRPLRQGLQETFNAIAASVPQAAIVPAPTRQAAAIALGAGVGLLLVWLFTRRRKG